MTAPPDHTYQIPDLSLLVLLQDGLPAGYSLAGDTAQELERSFFDTFDWRLYRAGRLLQEKHTAQSRGLQLCTLLEGRPVASVLTTHAPDWPEQLPEGSLRTALLALTEMRVLLPLVRVVSELQHYRILNEDAKTVVRLRCERPRVVRGSPDAPEHSLPPRLQLVAMRGYGAEAATIAALLEADDRVEVAPHTLFEASLRAVGRVPGDYSSKLAVPLSAEMTAGQAARLIWQHLLATLEANIAGTKADLDSEFLHDLRVATRRTRSALSQIKGVLPEPLLADFKARFGWLGQITGPTRDLDVFLLELPRYRAALPAPLRADLDPLEDFLRRHQAEAQDALRQTLESAEFTRLLTDWAALLTDWPASPTAPNAQRPVQVLAAERIWKMFRRILREGRAIGPDSPHEDLHELRKSCKKLRYLIEFFSALYPLQQTKPLIKTLKVLLDNLGQFQDLEVQADKLRAFAAQMQAESAAVPLPTLLAMGALIGDLLARQYAAREAFASRFAAFDTAANRAAYRALCQLSPGGQGA